jgi:CspA family cold shock protein
VTTQTQTKTVLGTVVKFRAKEGYGFIRPDGQDTDIFVHFSSIYSPVNEDPIRSLVRDQRVSFQIADTERGPKAVNVRVIPQGEM